MAAKDDTITSINNQYDVENMVRTQIQLTEQQARALRELAAEKGVSMAELIRQAVERVIEENERDEKWRRALSAMGQYRSGLTDVAENHDKYLDEDYLK